jgi:lipase chaperone LimK
MNARNFKLGLLTLVAAAGATAVWMLARAEREPAHLTAAEPNYFAFVRSMDGTRPDGDIRQDAADQLVINAELGHLFDYYLAGLGEQSLAAIQAEIHRELDRRLRPTAATQAKLLLEHYLQYKRALVDVERGLAPAAAASTPASTPAAAARQRLDAMQRLRRDYFTEQEIAGLFADSDAYDSAAIARMEIMADTSLTPEQRKQKLAALDARLPAAVREDREAPTRVLRLEDAVQQARAKGADDNEVYRLRAAALSPAAAARFADLDREEADWKRRITDYQAQRKQLMNGPAAPSDATLQQLRDAAFTPDEQKRLAAYE